MANGKQYFGASSPTVGVVDYGLQPRSVSTAMQPLTPRRPLQPLTPIQPYWENYSNWQYRLKRNRYLYNNYLKSLNQNKVEVNPNPYTDPMAINSLSDVFLNSAAKQNKYGDSGFFGTLKAGVDYLKYLAEPLTELDMGRFFTQSLNALGEDLDIIANPIKGAITEAGTGEESALWGLLAGGVTAGAIALSGGTLAPIVLGGMAAGGLTAGAVPFVKDTDKAMLGVQRAYGLTGEGRYNYQLETGNPITDILAEVAIDPLNAVQFGTKAISRAVLDASGMAPKAVRAISRGRIADDVTEELFNKNLTKSARTIYDYAVRVSKPFETLDDVITRTAFRTNPLSIPLDITKGAVNSEFVRGAVNKFKTKFYEAIDPAKISDGFKVDKIQQGFDAYSDLAKELDTSAIRSEAAFADFPDLFTDDLFVDYYDDLVRKYYRQGYTIDVARQLARDEGLLPLFNIASDSDALSKAYDGFQRFLSDRDYDVTEFTHWKPKTDNVAQHSYVDFVDNITGKASVQDEFMTTLTDMQLDVINNMRGKTVREVLDNTDSVIKEYLGEDVSLFELLDRSKYTFLSDSERYLVDMVRDSLSKLGVTEDILNKFFSSNLDDILEAGEIKINATDYSVSSKIKFEIPYQDEMYRTIQKNIEISDKINPMLGKSDLHSWLDDDYEIFRQQGVKNLYKTTADKIIGTFTTLPNLDGSVTVKENLVRFMDVADNVRTLFDIKSKELKKYPIFKDALDALDAIKKNSKSLQDFIVKSLEGRYSSDAIYASYMNLISNLDRLGKSTDIFRAMPEVFSDNDMELIRSIHNVLTPSEKALYSSTIKELTGRKAMFFQMNKRYQYTAILTELMPYLVTAMDLLDVSTFKGQIMDAISRLDMTNTVLEPIASHAREILSRTKGWYNAVQLLQNADAVFEKEVYKKFFDFLISMDKPTNLVSFYANMDDAQLTDLIDRFFYEYTDPVKVQAKALFKDYVDEMSRASSTIPIWSIPDSNFLDLIDNFFKNDLDEFLTFVKDSNFQGQYEAAKKSFATLMDKNSSNSIYSTLFTTLEGIKEKNDRLQRMYIEVSNRGDVPLASDFIRESDVLGLVYTENDPAFRSLLKSRGAQFDEAGNFIGFDDELDFLLRNPTLDNQENRAIFKWEAQKSMLTEVEMDFFKKRVGNISDSEYYHQVFASYDIGNLNKLMQDVGGDARIVDAIQDLQKNHMDIYRHIERVQKAVRIYGHDTVWTGTKGFNDLVHNNVSTFSIMETSDVASFIKHNTPGIFVVNDNLLVQGFPKLVTNQVASELEEYGIQVIKEKGFTMLVENSLLNKGVEMPDIYKNLSKTTKKYGMYAPKEQLGIYKEVNKLYDLYTQVSTKTLPFDATSMVPYRISGDKFMDFATMQGLPITLDYEAIVGKLNNADSYMFLVLENYNDLSVHFPETISGSATGNIYNMLYTVTEHQSNQARALSTVFNANYRIDSVFKGISDEDILDVLKDSRNFKMAYMDKKGKIHSLDVTNLASLDAARQVNAVVTSSDYFSYMYKAINQNKLTNSTLRFFTNTIQSAFNAFYLSSIGTVLRNFIDAVTKNAVVTGDMMGAVDAVYRGNKFISRVQKIVEMMGEAKETMSVAEFLSTLSPEDKYIYTAYKVYSEATASGTKISDMVMQLAQALDPNLSAGMDIDFSSVINKIAWENPVTKTTMKAFSRVEDMARFGLFLYEFEQMPFTKLGFSDLFKMLSETHFDYSTKTMAEIYGQIVIPFLTFPLKNFMFWSKYITENPMVLQTAVVSAQESWIEDKYNWQKASQHGYQNAMLMSGNVQSQKDNYTTLLKYNPSLFDAISFIPGIIHDPSNRVSAPLKILGDVVTGATSSEDYEWDYPGKTNLERVYKVLTDTIPQVVENGELEHSFGLVPSFMQVFEYEQKEPKQFAPGSYVPIYMQRVQEYISGERTERPKLYSEVNRYRPYVSYNSSGYERSSGYGTSIYSVKNWSGVGNYNRKISWTIRNMMKRSMQYRKVNIYNNMYTQNGYSRTDLAIRNMTNPTSQSLKYRLASQKYGFRYRF